MALHLPRVMVKLLLTHTFFIFRKIESCTSPNSFYFLGMVFVRMRIYASGKIVAQNNVKCHVQYRMHDPIFVFNE